MLPEEAKRPAYGESDERTNGGCLDNDPHEREQAVRRIETPNAADDEQPVPRATHERREDSGADRETRREIVAAAAIVRLWAPWTR